MLTHVWVENGIHRIIRYLSWVALGSHSFFFVELVLVALGDLAELGEPDVCLGEPLLDGLVDGLGRPHRLTDRGDHGIWDWSPGRCLPPPLVPRGNWPGFP